MSFQLPSQPAAGRGSHDPQLTLHLPGQQGEFPPAASLLRQVEVVECATMTCSFTDREGRVFGGAERRHGGESGLPGAGWLQLCPQQPGGEGCTGGRSGHLHDDHQDAAATAEVALAKVLVLLIRPPSECCCVIRESCCAAEKLSFQFECTFVRFLTERASVCIHM